ncbi:MAG TPA: hypothetical protein VER98_03965, partial [Terriglobia bacterium]|nr:hypothetical protein [Terriglobia bacterium]
MKRILLAFLIGLFSLPAYGQYTKISGFCEDGNQTVTTQGLTSTTLVQRSFPSCTVAVYNGGTAVVATVYANSAGLALGNPFTAATDGQWGFYGTPGNHYDTTFSNAGIASPFTRSDWVAPALSASVCNYAANQLVCQVGTVPPADILIDDAVNSFPGDTGVGNAALRNILAGGGFFSTGVGFQAGTALTSGYQDTLIGYQAGLALTTGYQSIGIGDNALTATTGFQNTVVGSGAGNTIT